ncbi:MAG: amidohydrolase family protein [Planctomycetota bacterium]
MASSDRTAHERNLPYNAAKSVAFGLSIDEAMRGLTLSTAEILEVGDEIGSLDAGKAATLIIADGNPLEVTTETVAAFIDGRQIDVGNKQTVLAEKYRAKYRQTGMISGDK